MDSIKRTVMSSLSEIIKTSASENNVFNDYVSQESIGKKIFGELHKRLVDIDDVKKGFIMNDNSNEIGILSQCQSLQSLVSLASDFGLDFNKKDIIPEQKQSIREIMDAVIEDIIPRILKTNESGETEFVFDASPYDTAHYSSKYSNIDAITWVLPSFFLILKYHASIHEVCKWEDKLIDIIRHGLKYINDAFIESDDLDNGLSIGWNFTKDCEEPSLYFTFSVGECYMDMFNTFSDILTYLEAERNFKNYRLPIDKDLKESFEQKEAEYRAGLSKKVHNKLEARFDEYNELSRIYRRINGIDDLDELRINDTLYGDLESKCRRMAEEVWRYVGKNLADQFFYNDLNTTLTETDIRMSTTSDALFNTVYIVNILIDGGLDETFKVLEQVAINSGKNQDAIKYRREYNNLLESCQLAVQKAFRTYESLKNDAKDYIVDQFLIGFNERFDVHKVMVNELRKLRMKTFSLLPLLIHTNNVISEYLIKYPQHNMRKYLEYILDNRFTSSGGDIHWIWEIDGYFSGSNYYYVSALNEFFTYHKKYERKYIAFGKKNEDREKEIITAHRKQLESVGGEIANLNADIKKNEEIIALKDEEITRLKKEIEEYHSPVEDAVREIIDEEFEKRFATMMADTFAFAAKALTVNEVDDTEDTDGVYSKLSASLRAMVMSDILSDYFSVTRKIKSVDDYNSTADMVGKDFNATVAAYITNLRHADDKTSKLKKFFD